MGGSLDVYFHDLAEKQASIEAKVLASFGLGIAVGMQYLEGLHVVHRDLAARNILLDDTLTVLVSDFGLSRCIDKPSDTENQGFYKMTHGANIPVRWTAPEALKSQKYTHASDMWSYGVVLWEIYTNAETPYADMTNEEVYLEVSNGYRLSRPDKCPDETYKSMKIMWSVSPEDRPSFS